jgi:hypothetical protein
MHLLMGVLRHTHGTSALAKFKRMCNSAINDQNALTKWLWPKTNANVSKHLAQGMQCGRVAAGMEIVRAWQSVPQNSLKV